MPKPAFGHAAGFSSVAGHSGSAARQAEGAFMVERSSGRIGRSIKWLLLQLGAAFLGPRPAPCWLCVRGERHGHLTRTLPYSCLLEIYDCLLVQAQNLC